MRLIDADELKSVTMWIDDAGFVEVYRASEIDNAPTVDAVEVVRCKHCRRWLNGDDTYGTCQWNEYQTLQTRYDDYCSHAERND